MKSYRLGAKLIRRAGNGEGYQPLKLTVQRTSSSSLKKSIIVHDQRPFTKMDHTTTKRSYLSLVEECDSLPLDARPQDFCYQLFIPGDDQPHGFIVPEIVEKMPWTSKFRLNHATPRTVTVLDSSQGQNITEAVTAAFTELVNKCIENGLFDVLAGRHSEPYVIPGAKYPVQVERFSMPLFGLTTRGAHMVAYTIVEGVMKLWIPRRAKHLYSAPGLLDTTVAGGVKATATPLETIVQEADEEASLPEDLVRRLVRSRGVITRINLTGAEFPGEKGLIVPDIIWVYDMELPSEVIPKPQDDEVEGFNLMTIEQVQSAMLNSEFKVDSSNVLLDFFIRHGIITANDEPDFVEIATRLHRKLPFRTTTRG